jgi:hypothetical protein
MDGIEADVPQWALALLMQAAWQPHQAHPIAQMMLQSPADAAAQIGPAGSPALHSGAERIRASRATWFRSSRSTSGNRRRAMPEAMATAPRKRSATARGRCSSTRASRALRAERLRAAADCRRREGESGEAILRTAKNPTPNGRPQRRGKDARRRRAPGLILDTA